MNKVTVWQMTEEQRLAYIEKYPIVKTEKPKRSIAFAELDHKEANERRYEALRKARAAKAPKRKVDYKWRGEKANESRWGSGSDTNL